MKYFKFPQKIALAAGIALATAFTISCSSDGDGDGGSLANRNNLSVKSSFTDSRDGKKYKTAKIGNQTWMAENLNYNPSTGNSACYDNQSSNCTKYGRLYDWNTAKSVCPKGWHLPSNDEWEVLVKTAGGEAAAGKKLKAKSGWNDYEGESGNGTDNYGFSALPGGGGGSDGSFDDVGYGGYWWSASEDFAAYAYYRYMLYSYEDAGWYLNGKYYLFSLRCLQD